MTTTGRPTDARLRPALDAEWRTLDTPRAGRVGWYADESATGPGSSRPLVLVHSLNAAPSAMEMKPLFERFRGRRPVLALDLPGFGRSERGDRDYTPERLADAVEAVVLAQGRGPVDVVALSLGAEIAARAIARDPTRYASLCMISPTGFSTRNPPTGPIVDGLERVIGRPWIGEPLFRALTSEASIRFFLARNFQDAPAEELIAYAGESARQPGARFAPLRFLAGRLFTPNAFDRLFAPLAIPALVLFDRDPNVRFDRLPDWLSARPHRTAVRIAPTLGLPHWEQPERCVAALESFWATEVEAGAASPAPTS
ncbi:MAG: alpha/beta fold hydrolase [Myxococcota bacterium]